MHKNFRCWLACLAALFLLGGLVACVSKNIDPEMDPRGGVYLVLQVDVDAGLGIHLDNIVTRIQTDLSKQHLGYESVTRNGQVIDVVLPDAQTLAVAVKVISSNDLQLSESTLDNVFVLQARLTPQALKNAQAMYVQQNIEMLHNRITHLLSTADYRVEQRGVDEIVVLLPGENDLERVKQVLGRVVTMQIRMVDDSPKAVAALSGQGAVPQGTELLTDRNSLALIVHKQALLTHENLTDVQADIDSIVLRPVLFLSFDKLGSDIFYRATLSNRGKRVAVVLFDENGQGVVVSAPVICEPIAGGRVQIFGSMSMEETQEIALLLRSGELMAHMKIIEERVIAPRL